MPSVQGFVFNIMCPWIARTLILDRLKLVFRTTRLKVLEKGQLLHQMRRLCKSVVSPLRVNNFLLWTE